MVFFINSFVAFRSTFTPYYALYYLGSETMISLILTIMYTLPLLGLLFLPKLIELFGNKNMFIISGICAMISGILSLAAKTNSALIILSAVFGGLTLSGVFANIWGCMPNVADYGEWKTGVRAPGLIYGLATFAIKLAVALSTYLVGWILNWANFDALLDMQSEHTIQFIYKANGILPIIFGIIGIILILPYDLTNEKIEEIKKELSERRQVIDE
jgi:Na+/melibiose symporter-like transporter